MKKSLLVLFIAFFSSAINAQIVRETLEGVHSAPCQDGILIYGYTGEIGDHSYSITQYDKEMNVVKTYSKKIPGEVTIAWSYSVVFGDHIDVFTKAKPQSFYIKLSLKLEELSATEISDNVKQEDKTIIKASNGIGLSIYGGPIETNTGSYDRGMKNIQFLNKDRFDFDPKDQSVVRYQNVPNLKLNSYFSKIWETPIEGFKKVKSSGIVFADDKNIVNCLITKGDNKFWDDCIIRLDAVSGKIISKIPTVFPEKEEIFFLSNAYFDPETEKIIAIGQLYKDKLKLEMHATAIMVYDKNGNLISSKKIEFPEYAIDAPRNIDAKDKAIVVNNIGKISKGNYFVITELDCQKTVTSNNGKGGSVSSSAYTAIGYSYFEMDESCAISNNKIQFLSNFKDGISTAKAKGNEKFVLLSLSTNDSKKIKTINFTADKDSMLQEVDDVDFNSNTTNYNPNYDADVYYQFIIDDKHAITFHKFRESNIYEAKSILIK
jgi:hypothetical protein